MSYGFVLRSSLIPNAGIGCFSTAQISPGSRLSADSGGFRRLLGNQIPDEYLKYCVLLPCGRYLAPQNFLCMGVFWYINHAKQPNAIFENGRLSLLRTIEEGEEITLYYSDLLTHPKNRLWVQLWDI